MLIYVKPLPEHFRMTATVVSSDAEKRAKFRIVVPRDFAMNAEEQAHKLACMVSRRIGKWERELQFSGDALVSDRYVGEDADGWYFVRTSAHSFPVTMKSD